MGPASGVGQGGVRRWHGPSSRGQEQEEGKTAELSAEAAAGSFLRQVAQPQW